MTSLARRFANFLFATKKEVLGNERLGFYAWGSLFWGKLGLEIGGPSDIFRSRDYLPVYPRAARIDGVNFATSTLWQPEIHAGAHYQYAGDKVGQQFVGEASDLHMIPDDSYDFVLSSHSLEHTANPLKCLAEWIRVLKPDGAILLVLPDSRLTFDHRRRVTSFQHLLDDFRKNTGEDDLTHLEEILTLHDLAQDPAAKDAESFRARSLRNLENRALHHHVFDANLVQQCFRHLQIRPRYTDRAPPAHLIALGTTPRQKVR